MNSVLKSSLKLVSLRVRNIEGMTATLVFNSNLIVIYGYNRTGKTILIRSLRYAFKGFKASGAKLSPILGDNTSGDIELVFDFKSVLYKINRELTKSNESIKFTKSKFSFVEYRDLPPPKRKSIWSSINSEELISKTSVKTRGTSSIIFTHTLNELKLYPEIIDRLIALDNNQEFKNATQSLSSREGGGFESIKELLYKDLKDKDDAIKDIIKYSAKTIQKLENQNVLIIQDYKTLMNDINQVITPKEITAEDKEDLNEIINVLKLNSSYDKNLKEFKLKLTNKQDSIEKEKKKAVRLETSIPNKEENYNGLRRLLETLKLKQLEDIVITFAKDKATINGLSSKINQIHRNIEDNPIRDSLDAISLDLLYLTSENIESLLERESLEKIDNQEILKSLPIQINKFIKNFNDALVLFNRNKELLTKHKIEPKQINNTISSYKSQLERIKNPIIFDKKDKIYTLYGRVEVDEVLEEKKLKIYMHLEDLKNYVREKEPLSIHHYISPAATSKNEEISEQAINELSLEISDIIKDLEELLEIQKNIEPIKSLLNKNLDEFNEIISTITNIDQIVSMWAEYITSQKSIAREFIYKNLAMKIKVRASFEEIGKNLVVIQEQYIEQLKNDFENLHLNYEKATLFDNLQFIVKYLSEFIERSSDSIEIIKELITLVSDRQEDYRTLCRNKELNEKLKDIIIPSIQIISSQIQSNIQLEKIEEKVMNDIKKNAEHFYRVITREGFLVLEKFSDNGKIFLKPYIRKTGGTKLEIMDSGPSGSEQASIALGIMVALANIFNGFVVIDEVTDRFDGPTKLRFFEAIQNISSHLFWIIVVKIDSSQKDVDSEFRYIKNSFPYADIFQTTKDLKNLTTSVHKVKSYEDLVLQEDYLHEI